MNVKELIEKGYATEKSIEDIRVFYSDLDDYDFFVDDIYNCYICFCEEIAIITLKNLQSYFYVFEAINIKVYQNNIVIDTEDDIMLLEVTERRIRKLNSGVYV